MNKNYEIYATSVKIMLLLNLNNKLFKRDLVYLIALSEFYLNDTMENSNLKNFNPLSNYYAIINSSLSLLLTLQMIDYNGKFYNLTASGQIFINDFNSIKDNDGVKKKINYIYSKYYGQKNIDKIYEDYFDKFLKERLNKNYEN